MKAQKSSTFWVRIWTWVARLAVFPPKDNLFLRTARFLPQVVPPVAEKWIFVAQHFWWQPTVLPGIFFFVKSPRAQFRGCIRWIVWQNYWPVLLIIQDRAFWNESEVTRFFHPVQLNLKFTNLRKKLLTRGFIFIMRIILRVFAKYGTSLFK